LERRVAPTMESRLSQSASTSLTTVDAVHGLLRDQSGAPVRMVAIHLSWHRHIDYCWERGLYPLILAPFAHGKTIQLTIGRTCDFIGRARLARPDNSAPILGRNARIKIVCNDDGNARERVRVIGEVCESPEFQAIFPLIRRSTTRPWNSEEINFERDPGIRLPDSSVTASG
jgi:hypothetical protein